jgi:hypothetical protein
MALNTKLRPFIFLILIVAFAGCSAPTRLDFFSDETNRKLFDLTENEPFVWKDASRVFAIGSDSKSVVAMLATAGYNCETDALEINCRRRIGSFSPFGEEFLNVHLNVGPKKLISNVSVRHIGAGL